MEYHNDKQETSRLWDHAVYMPRVGSYGSCGEGFRERINRASVDKARALHVLFQQSQKKYKRRLKRGPRFALLVGISEYSADELYSLLAASSVQQPVESSPFRYGLSQYSRDVAEMMMY